MIVEDRQEITDRVLAVRTMQVNIEDEKEMSITDWVDAVRECAVDAVQHARSGDVGSEEERWLLIAAIAVGRIEQIKDLADA